MLLSEKIIFSSYFLIFFRTKTILKKIKSNVVSKLDDRLNIGNPFEMSNI